MKNITTSTPKLKMNKFDKLFKLINDLVLCHSPSGVENEIDELICNKLKALNIHYRNDPAGNIIVKIKGKNSKRSIAIVAHKDEIGAIVKSIQPDGKLSVRNLGSSFPWVYGEGVVDVIGDNKTIPGILCFGSRHVSYESKQKIFQFEKPLQWDNVWIDTKLSLDDLESAGIRIGSRVVVGKHRKIPLRMGQYIGSYSLDNKASLAVLLMLADRLKNPECDVYLVASSKEEISTIGAMYFTQNNTIDLMIALEICPKSDEYNLSSDTAPILLEQDSYSIYDFALNKNLRDLGRKIKLPLQTAVLSSFGSDASACMRNGTVAQAACVCFLTENTHGYEIVNMNALENCCLLLEAFCKYPLLNNILK